MEHRIESNLFNRSGAIDLAGDEDEINPSSITYPTAQDALDAVECLAMRYPNAIVDIV